MNERQPYEQLIADKLQQLPAPDVNKSWQQMKRLLDDSQSPGGGGGGKRSPGGGRWWGAGIIAIVLITGVWVFIESRSSSQKELASAKHPATKEAAAANKDAPAKNDASVATQFKNHSTNNAPDQTSTQTNTTPASTGKTGTTPPGSTGNNNGDDHGSAAAGTPAPARAGSLPVTADNNKPGAEYSKSLPENKNSKDKDKTASNRRRRSVPLPAPPGNRETTAVAHNTPKTPGRTITTNNHAPAHRPGHRNSDLVKNQGARPSGTKDTSPGARNNRPAPGNSINPADEQRLAKQRERRQHLEELIQPAPPARVNSYLAAGGHVNPYKDTSHLLNDKTKALMAKSRLPDSNTATAKKAKKSFHLNLDIKPFSLKTDTDAWWGAGLSLNAALPVGGQNRYKYNVNGGTGLLTDYLPSPYVEFHLNSYVYLQTEINLSAPQYLPQVCLFQKTGMPYNGGGPSFTQRDQSIFIQKLYYFSWPVSLHYSPVNNLYLTTGLQFSSFQSGLALINERRFNPGGSTPDSYSSKLVKFKDDSIAAQLRPNEWRWQLGAEYYWNRFTLGMRYNKAFTDLVSIGPGMGIPEAKVRNSALLFFVRFNFFEGRKKDNLSKASNSLVRY